MELKQAESLTFLPTHKKALAYKFIDGGVPNYMPPLSYTESKTEQTVVTVTGDGKETTNVAQVGDFIMSGISGENYVVKKAKFPKLYEGEFGRNVVVDQTPRMVATYFGPTFEFTASWGELMICKDGDYLVKDGDNYYRIAKAEYEETYNQPGQ